MAGRKHTANFSVLFPQSLSYERVIKLLIWVHIHLATSSPSQKIITRAKPCYRLDRSRRNIVLKARLKSTRVHF